ncbi:uncharacterized protein [Clytia hemisphaerica]|uniref:Cnidarian restricted protein n=1 Tax=Clytia hemisphaerica TaxID=252671 RepID=A0A7M5WXR4_9CNID
MKLPLILKIIAMLLISYHLVDGEKGDNKRGKTREEAKQRQREARKEFNKIKTEHQLDRKIANSIMRADKKEGKLAIQRRGQYFQMKIKEILEKRSQEEKAWKWRMKDAEFDIVRNETDFSFGVQAGFIQMSAELANGANITLQLFMFKDAGNITGEDGNIYELVKGGTKANIIIHWPNQVDHLDVVILIKCGFDGKKSRKAKKKSKARGRNGSQKAVNRRHLETFSVCSNAQMTFSPSYFSNGEDVDMQDGYPEPQKLSKKEESTEIVLRFNATNIFYDPTVETGDDIGDDSEDDSEEKAEADQALSPPPRGTPEVDQVLPAPTDINNVANPSNEGESESIAEKTTIPKEENEEANLMNVGRNFITGRHHSSDGVPSLTSPVLLLVNLVSFALLKSLIF